MANEFRLSGLNVSPSGVRGVWLRHDLETRFKRLLRLAAFAPLASQPEAEEDTMPPETT